MSHPPHFEGQFTNFMDKKRELLLTTPEPYLEFPKAVTLRNGTQVRADSQSDEIRIIAEDSSDKTKLHPAEARADDLASRLGEAEESLAEAQRELVELKAKAAAANKPTDGAMKPSAPLGELGKLIADSTKAA